MLGWQSMLNDQCAFANVMYKNIMFDSRSVLRARGFLK